MSAANPFGQPIVQESAEPESVTRERNRQLQFLTETFPDGVVYQYTITCDGRKLLTYLGRGAEQIFGERPPELVSSGTAVAGSPPRVGSPARPDDTEAAT